MCIHCFPSIDISYVCSRAPKKKKINTFIFASVSFCAKCAKIPHRKIFSVYSIECLLPISQIPNLQFLFYFLYRIMDATPTAELEPLEAGKVAQTDEVKWLPHLLVHAPPRNAISSTVCEQNRGGWGWGKLPPEGPEAVEHIPSWALHLNPTMGHKACPWTPPIWNVCPPPFYASDPQGCHEWANNNWWQ